MQYTGIFTVATTHFTSPLLVVSPPPTRAELQSFGTAAA